MPAGDAYRGRDQGAAATVPLVMAFGVLGIVKSVIILSSVVSGAAGTSLRRIRIRLSRPLPAMA